MNILLTGIPLCLQNQTSMSSLIATNLGATLAGKNYNYTTRVSDWRYDVFFLWSSGTNVQRMQIEVVIGHEWV